MTRMQEYKGKALSFDWYLSSQGRWKYLKETNIGQIQMRKSSK